MSRKKPLEGERDIQVALTDWVKKDVHMGTPTIALLPAANYLFKVHKKEHKVTIPRRGVYEKLDPKAYNKDDGEFSLFDKKNSVLYMPAISKILFATKQYPDLKSNQLFAPIALVFRNDEVDIIGQIVEMIEPTELNSPANV